MRQQNRRSAQALVRELPSVGADARPTTEGRSLRTFTIELTNIKVRNPLNGSQGFSRGAAMAHAAERRRLRDWARLHTLAHVPPDVRGQIRSGLCDAYVLIRRISPRKYDDDNWIAAAKPLRDGVADAFLQRDDHVCFRWAYDQVKGPADEHHVRIFIQVTEKK